MRVIAQITAGYEELREELKRFPAKQRAERMRLLASIGLFALEGRAPQVTTTAGVAVVPAEDSGTSQGPAGSRTIIDLRRNRLKGKFKSSLRQQGDQPLG